MTDASKYVEPRNVEGLTRSEFEKELRIGYQHDNVRARERGRDAPVTGLTPDQEREIAERVELNYPSSGTFSCPICGTAEPHQHTGAEIAKHRGAVDKSTVDEADEWAALTKLPWLDQSMADPIEKARRVLEHLIEPNQVYYFEDGFPRPELKQQAANCLAVLNALAACPQPVARTTAVLNDERATFEAWGNETFNYGFQPDTWDAGEELPVAREACYQHEGTQMAWEGWQARATIPQPVAQPVEQPDEAAAWFTDDHLTDKSATTWDHTTAERWKAKGWSVNELYIAQPVEQTADSARLRFLADDIADADVRRARNELLERMPVMSYSAVCMQIDAILIEHGLALNVAPQNNATSISDAMMDLVDRLGHEWKDVDPRAWSRLLVYAPQPVEQTRALTDDARNAARYQLLRRGQHWSVINGIGDTLRGEQLDAAIDAAMTTARPASGETN